MLKLAGNTVRDAGATLSRVKKLFGVLAVAFAALAALPAYALAAPEASDIGKGEKVTQAMFVIIFVIFLLLCIAVWFESRKEY